MTILRFDIKVGDVQTQRVNIGRQRWTGKYFTTTGANHYQVTTENLALRQLRGLGDMSSTQVCPDDAACISIGIITSLFSIGTAELFIPTTTKDDGVMSIFLAVPATVAETVFLEVR